MKPIGGMRAERLTCADEHLPAVYNTAMDRTWCICGGQTWDGKTPTLWASVERFRERADAREIPRGMGMGANGLPDRYESLGWDTYELRTT